MRARLLLVMAAALLLPSAVAAQEAVEYYALDAIGSVRVVFDENGNVKGRADFTPFGVQLDPEVALPVERFGGLVRDGEAGLDYAQARSYQARSGRFSTIDPIFSNPEEPQRWNRYSYVLNQPLTYVDRTGKTPQPIIAPAIQGAILWHIQNAHSGVTAPYPQPLWTSLWNGVVDLFLAIVDESIDAFGGDLHAPGTSGRVTPTRDPEKREPSAGTIIAGAIIPSPQVRSKKLQNIVEMIYKGTRRKTRIGDGTTMDAIRHELATGELVKGKDHLNYKGPQMIRALENWFKENPDGDYHDRLVAQSLLDELRSIYGIDSGR